MSKPEIDPVNDTIMDKSITFACKNKSIRAPIIKIVKAQ